MLAMFVATVSFAISLWYSHFLLLPLDERALAIIENSVPSIEHLAQARVSLIRIRTLVGPLPPSGTSTSIAGAQLQAARQDLISELQQYRSLPTTAEESRLLSELDAELAHLSDSEIASPGTAAAGARSLNERLARAADLLERLQRLNANEALSNANEIVRLRRHTAQTATLLGFGSLGVAVVALLTALIVLRGQARLMHQHSALLAQRGAELEAFSGRVAHDLRDPLSAIALGIQVAKRDSEAAARSSPVLERIGRQVVRMNDIIEGLLEFARAGASPTPGARADLAAVLAEVVETLRPRAAAAQADLTLERFDPVQVACTPAALTSIAANLIGNAVKYIVESPDATRRIHVLVKERGGLVRVEVTDNGPGLPPGADQLIFEPFHRLRETKQPGIGLGLATVKKVVEAYRGRVGVSSRLGQGSTFWFELPLRSNHASAASAPDRALSARG